MEDLMKESCSIELNLIRKENSKRVTLSYYTFVQHYHRKRIETVGSLIERVLLKTMHAVTARGFELKVFCLSWPIASTAYKSQLGLC